MAVVVQVEVVEVAVVALVEAAVAQSGATACRQGGSAHHDDIFPVCRCT